MYVCVFVLQLTSLIIFTASLVRPSFLEHMASLLFIYTNTLVSLPDGDTQTFSSAVDPLQLHWGCGCKASRDKMLLWMLMRLTVLRFILCTVVLELLAPAVATFARFERLLK